MSASRERPDVDAVLNGLKDFQRDTVDYVFRRLYTDADATRRFLVADEVGLGKTLVARGLIARAVDHLWDEIDKIDVVYICSNSEIARQNVQRLAVSGGGDFAPASRMTLLPSLLGQMRGRKLNFISFTPGTSFQMKDSGGWAPERVMLYRLLRRAWDVKGTGALNLLQGRVTEASYFRDMVARAEQEPKQRLDDAIVSAFADALEHQCTRERSAGKADIRARFEGLCREFSYSRNLASIPEVQRAAQFRLIGDLRHALAATCIRSLEPDLVILDEFQRFKSLLHEDDEASLLAQELFNYESESGKARTLLLSATPYKMYTVGDGATDDDHYADFVRTISFLQNDAQATTRVRSVLASYRQAFLRLSTDGPAPLATLKTELERELRRVMVRTERLAASEDRSGMLRDASAEHAIQLQARDVKSYRALQQLARQGGHHDTIEYWKAAPFLLNFMRDYKLKRGIDEALNRNASGAVADLLDDETLFMTKRAMSGCAPANPPHARMRWLEQDTLGRGLWQLLWLPPSLPYYELGSPFAKVAAAGGVTKRLIFSAWRVVPRVISPLLSQEAERLMFGAALKRSRSLDAARKGTAQLLRFSRADGRLSGMPVMGMLYPSIALARLCDPIDIAAELSIDGTLPSLDEVLVAARTRIAPLLDAITTGRVLDGGAADESWYWAAPALLDVAADPGSREWIEAMKSPGLDSPEDGDAIDHTSWNDHAVHFREVVLGNGKLGPLPDDLAEVLALLSIAGPGVTALRALTRVAGGAGQLASAEVRTAAARVAWALRNLFNLKEVTALLNAIGGDDAYWRRVLRYTAAGGIQSMLDEYAHVIPESLGVVDRSDSAVATKIADEIIGAMGLRTAVVTADTFARDADGAVTRGEQRLRTRFAARFGEKEEDAVGAQGATLDAHTRSGQLRSAFNSPFWPFVLATTTVGQEGLDFHHYCHAVVHWNLPSNPVDLEQREGRVHRYKGHAVRRNVAKRYGRAALGRDVRDPWSWMFEQAKAARPTGVSDIVPYWVFPLPDGATIERHVPVLPFSQDIERHEALRRTLAVYRMVFGQPRQDELLDYLMRRMSREEAEGYLELLRIDLSPGSASTPLPAPVDPVLTSGVRAFDLVTVEYSAALRELASE